MGKPSDPTSSPQTQGPSTTFVLTDANSFKELVQRLTGPNDESSAHAPSTDSSPPLRIAGVRRPPFKLHERRQGSRSKLAIIRPKSPLTPLMGFSSSSLSGLVSPAAYLSELMLTDETSPKMLRQGLNEEAEERAIKERRFYLHPSPRGSRSASSEPKLLPLFPLSSPSPKPVGL